MSFQPHTQVVREAVHRVQAGALLHLVSCTPTYQNNPGAIVISAEVRIDGGPPPFPATVDERPGNPGVYDVMWTVASGWVPGASYEVWVTMRFNSTVSSPTRVATIPLYAPLSTNTLPDEVTHYVRSSDTPGPVTLMNLQPSGGAAPYTVTVQSSTSGAPAVQVNTISDGSMNLTLHSSNATRTFDYTYTLQLADAGSQSLVLHTFRARLLTPPVTSITSVANVEPGTTTPIASFVGGAAVVTTSPPQVVETAGDDVHVYLAPIQGPGMVMVDAHLEEGGESFSLSGVPLQIFVHEPLSATAGSTIPAELVANQTGVLAHVNVTGNVGDVDVWFRVAGKPDTPLQLVAAGAEIVANPSFVWPRVAGHSGSVDAEVMVKDKVTGQSVSTGHTLRVWEPLTSLHTSGAGVTVLDALQADVQFVAGGKRPMVSVTVVSGGLQHSPNSTSLVPFTGVPGSAENVRVRATDSAGVSVELQFAHVHVVSIPRITPVHHTALGTALSSGSITLNVDIQGGYPGVETSISWGTSAQVDVVYDAQARTLVLTPQSGALTPGTRMQITPSTPAYHNGLVPTKAHDAFTLSLMNPSWVLANDRILTNAQLTAQESSHAYVASDHEADGMMRVQDTFVAGVGGAPRVACVAVPSVTDYDAIAAALATAAEELSNTTNLKLRVNGDHAGLTALDGAHGRELRLAQGTAEPGDKFILFPCDATGDVARALALPANRSKLESLIIRVEFQTSASVQKVVLYQSRTLGWPDGWQGYVKLHLSNGHVVDSRQAHVDHGLRLSARLEVYSVKDKVWHVLRRLPANSTLADLANMLRMVPQRQFEHEHAMLSSWRSKSKRVPVLTFRMYVQGDNVAPVDVTPDVVSDNTLQPIVVDNGYTMLTNAVAMVQINDSALAPVVSVMHPYVESLEGDGGMVCGFLPLHHERDRVLEALREAQQNEAQ